MADVAARRRLGRTGVEVTQLGFGGASIGELFVRSSTSDDAVGAVSRRMGRRASGYFDTAPWYGRGLSELRTGSGLRDRPRHEYVLSTKIGRWLRPPSSEPTSTGARGSAAPRHRGRLRLLVRRDHAVLRAEPAAPRAHRATTSRSSTTSTACITASGDARRHFGQLAASGWRAIEELKASGLIRGDRRGDQRTRPDPALPRAWSTSTPSSWRCRTPSCTRRSSTTSSRRPSRAAVGFVIGAPFQSGILATGPKRRRHVRLRARRPPEVQDRRSARIEAVCERHGVPLGGGGAPVPARPSGRRRRSSRGPSTRRRSSVTSRRFAHPIPADLWAELKHEGLLREDAPVPA